MQQSFDSLPEALAAATSWASRLYKQVAVIVSRDGDRITVEVRS